MWEPQPLTTLRASKACRRESFTLPLPYHICRISLSVTEGTHHLRFAEENIYTFLKNAVFWDVAPCSFCVNRRFWGTYCLHFQGRKIRERGTSVSSWLQTELQAICSSETSVHGRTTRRHILENGILHSHRRENLKSYIYIFLFGHELQFPSRDSDVLVTLLLAFA
jgi:hypothetical protein